ncbi:PIN-like domain-containing protein [Actinoplanes sp. DH11]|uniref:PIN-like domain-containing protein n=1 Tax=Actinoplanes sp. DH11 TaxID=2857011 RepID=UPI001E2EE3F0|nr:PIN-like domain-containing protein [Actinoplanes sp. DH11]
MSQAAKQPLLLTRYQSWLTSRQESIDNGLYKPFFVKGLVVLDANVLLDLYRYTQEPRSQVLAALRLIARGRRLWLPHQVALEFARNRPKAVEGRLKRLSAVRGIVDDQFQSAVRAIADARNEMSNLLRDMAHDDAAADILGKELDEAAINSVLKPWRDKLSSHLTRLRTAENLTPRHVAAANEPLLIEIATLFGTNIGDPPAASELQRLVHHAVNYRYPNRIPPGYADQGKSTDLARAGDYLLWEEMLQHAMTLPEPRRILFVSRDTKEDWYEKNEKGQPVRPWPALHDEMRARANADLLILTPKDFLQGAVHFLGAKLEAGTYKEIDRVSKDVDDDFPRIDPIDPEVPLANFSAPYPYTTHGTATAPKSPGVHVVLEGDVVVFVGHTGDLRARLRQHIYGPRRSSVLHDRVGRLLDTPERDAPAADIAEWLSRCTVRWGRTDDPSSAKEVLVRELQPIFNR